MSINGAVEGADSIVDIIVEGSESSCADSEKASCVVVKSEAMTRSLHAAQIACVSQG